MKFSIVIPSYNSEKYIKRCLLSIIQQEFEDYEIIVVDDQSTDETKNIVRNIKSNKIKFYSIKHKGVSAARNFGIHKAKGKFIIFVDSDDYLSDSSLKYLNSVVNDIEVTYISMFNTINDEGVTRKCVSEKFEKECISDDKSSTLDYLYKKRMIYSVWRFIASREMIIKNNLFFKEGIIHEDELWVPRLLCCSKRFSLIDNNYYNYVLHDNSIMTSEFPNYYRVKCLIDVSNELLELANKSKNLTDTKCYLRNCYKNLFQAYLKVRGKAFPIEPDTGKVNKRKNILIYGSSRSGKTTLANLIRIKFGYSVVSLDSIVSAFEHGMPETGVDHRNRDGKTVTLVQPFVDSYIHSLNGMDNKSKGYNYVIEGAYFTKETLLNYDEDTIVLVLINGIDSAALFDSIRKHDTIHDWTNKYDDQKLLNYCENIVNNEEYILNVVKGLNCKIYSTAIDRENTFNNILHNLENLIKE